MFKASSFVMLAVRPSAYHPAPWTSDRGTLVSPRPLVWSSSAPRNPQRGDCIQQLAGRGGPWRHTHRHCVLHTRFPLVVLPNATGQYLRRCTSQHTQPYPQCTTPTQEYQSTTHIPCLRANGGQLPHHIPRQARCTWPATPRVSADWPHTDFLLHSSHVAFLPFNPGPPPLPTCHTVLSVVIHAFVEGMRPSIQ